jgi:hypothetical protein
MAILKHSSAALFRREIHHTAIPHESADLIQDPVALAIWLYLLQQHHTWIPRSTDIERRFNIGKHKRKNAMRHLRDLGLVFDHYEHDDQGRINRFMVVSDLQNPDAVRVSEAVDQVITRGAENQPHSGSSRGADFLTDGKSNPLINDQDLTRDQEKSFKDHPADDHRPDLVSDGFECFWGAGLRKVAKVRAKKAWAALCKAEGGDPLALAAKLCTDIKTRLGLGQYGFDQLHPATYLNGRRWEDEAPTAQPNQKPKINAELHQEAQDAFDRAVRKLPIATVGEGRTRRLVNMNQSEVFARKQFASIYAEEMSKPDGRDPFVQRVAQGAPQGGSTLRH